MGNYTYHSNLLDIIPKKAPPGAPMIGREPYVSFFLQCPNRSNFL